MKKALIFGLLDKMEHTYQNFYLKKVILFMELKEEVQV